MLPRRHSGKQFSLGAFTLQKTGSGYRSLWQAERAQLPSLLDHTALDALCNKARLQSRHKLLKMREGASAPV
jgi:hypothetical protein